MASPPLPPDLESRRQQVFPVLDQRERERLRRFGGLRAYRSGELLFSTGDLGTGLLVILDGWVSLVGRGPLGDNRAIAEEGPGSFLGEAAQLSGGPALVDARAMTDMEVLAIPPGRLRALLVEEAELGERIMRALILRRVGLIELGGGGPLLVGPPTHPDVLRLEEFLARNGHPYLVVDPSQDSDAAVLVRHHVQTDADLPLVLVRRNGEVLKNPSEETLARSLGLLSDEPSERVYDVAVVGAGPAGLATAVYAASEGLQVLVLDARAFGGQAGASTRIENYFGFPTGITGQALAARGLLQAQKFGARMQIPAEVARLRCGNGERPHALELADGRQVQARTVVIASGARYRRPALQNLERFEGRGVSYWASRIEAQMCAGEEVVLVGGGNSAGQGAVFLAGHARKVRMLVRGRTLAASMSSYLVERLSASPRIDVHFQTEVIALDGAVHLERVRCRHRATGVVEQRPVRHLFLFIGADPATEWLDGCGMALDDKGFVPTGAQAGVDRGRRVPQLLETNLPGVFAIGDVRAGSVKRIGAAIGEGSAVVAQIHTHLATLQRGMVSGPSTVPGQSPHPAPPPPAL